MWRDGAKVYLIGVDNNEQALTDVDIFDITDPDATPVAVARVRLRPGVPDPSTTSDASATTACCTTWSSRRSTACRRCWPPTGTRGYVLLNVDDPADPHTSATRRSATTDPLTGKTHGRGQRPPGRVLARQQVHPRGRRGLQRPSLRRARSTRAPRASYMFRSAGQRRRGPAALGTERPLDRRHALRRPRRARAATIPPATRGRQRSRSPNAFNCNFQVKTENAEARGYTGSIIFNSTRRRRRRATTLSTWTSRATRATSCPCSCPRGRLADDGRLRPGDLPVRRRDDPTPTPTAA